MAPLASAGCQQSRLRSQDGASRPSGAKRSEKTYKGTIGHSGTGAVSPWVLNTAPIAGTSRLARAERREVKSTAGVWLRLQLSPYPVRLACVGVVLCI
ncbi:hypothetical protein BDV95DRAFT_189375 [Massariosphaeria phaeospora]|uniref:Uncharacterized protein n=1 Tax=Massariosphaeria phaeospora TaxID=100035 RepID=A0A7C8M351_9PLEO|nr:hypothetical protein BDV95DRAFT_189375 [Massariosphaeria phaeospora]